MVDCQKCYYPKDWVWLCPDCGYKFCLNCVYDKDYMSGASQCPNCKEWTHNQVKS